MFESYTQDKGAVGPHKHTSSPAKPEGTIAFNAAQGKKSQKSHIVFSRISTIFAGGKLQRPQRHDKSRLLRPKDFRAGHKPVSARKLEWWNGRHEGLKILWPLRLCGFESRFEYREPRRIFCVALLFLQFRIFAARFFSLYHSLRFFAPSIYGVMFLCAIVSRDGIIGQAGYKKRRRRILRRRWYFVPIKETWLRPD